MLRLRVSERCQRLQWGLARQTLESSGRSWNSNLRRRVGYDGATANDRVPVIGKRCAVVRPPDYSTSADGATLARSPRSIIDAADARHVSSKNYNRLLAATDGGR